jgi:hypothetical protein
VNEAVSVEVLVSGKAAQGRGGGVFAAVQGAAGVLPVAGERFAERIVAVALDCGAGLVGDGGDRAEAIAVEPADTAAGRAFLDDEIAADVGFSMTWPLAPSVMRS